jgi:hypothetical protein
MNFLCNKQVLAFYFYTKIPFLNQFLCYIIYLGCTSKFEKHKDYSTNTPETQSNPAVDRRFIS